MIKGLVSNGQLKNGEAEPVIIGGMVLDIHATPSVLASPGTTTPGMVYTSFDFKFALLN